MVAAGSGTGSWFWVEAVRQVLYFVQSVGVAYSQPKKAAECPAVRCECSCSHDEEAIAWKVVVLLTPVIELCFAFTGFILAVVLQPCCGRHVPASASPRRGGRGVLVES
jgi:hypothetical protein